MHRTRVAGMCVVIALRRSASGRKPSPEDPRKGMSRMEQIVVCHGCDAGITVSWI
jgi:hypothetical protein